MGYSFARSDRTANLRRTLRSQQCDVDMNKWQVVLRPNQVVHDLVVVINHYLFSDIGGVPTHLSGSASSQQNDADTEISFPPACF